MTPDLDPPQSFAIAAVTDLAKFLVIAVSAIAFLVMLGAL